VKKKEGGGHAESLGKDPRPSQEKKEPLSRSFEEEIRTGKKQKRGCFDAKERKRGVGTVHQKKKDHQSLAPPTERGVPDSKKKKKKKQGGTGLPPPKREIALLHRNHRGEHIARAEGGDKRKKAVTKAKKGKKKRRNAFGDW